MKHTKTIQCLISILLITIVSASCVPGPADTCIDPERLSERQISRCEYAGRLRAMWLGELIANWTGLTTEGVKQYAPFYTDDDWGRTPSSSATIDFVFQDPWLADDDTDIEYVYLHLIQQYNTPYLTPKQIADGWIEHVNDPIWGASPTRSLLGLGAMPPASGMGSINPTRFLNNESQLITEMFGALAPAMPEQALQLADLPIRTNSGGYTAHAAQFYVLLYSLASLVDPSMSSSEQIIWLVKEARQFIPDTSKTADIVDFVLSDFLDNPDVNDWERTRDRIDERYHQNAQENGFVYRGWLESSVNFATGVMALLYGEGDFNRTVQIGTLSGWDSDNGTATMGGLLGLMKGYDALVAEFPEVSFSDRYHIHRTRETLPDYLPDDPRAEDTLMMMAERMLPYVEGIILQAGGVVDGDIWTLPPISDEYPLDLNPYEQLYRRSANNQVRMAGGTVETSATDETRPSRTQVIGDGAEHDFSGREVIRPSQGYRRSIEEHPLTLTVTYNTVTEVKIIRFIEGGSSGFSTIDAEVLVEGVWQSLPEGTILSTEPDPKIPFQIIDFILPESIHANGIRVTGVVEGSFREIIVVELDAFSE